VRNTRRALHRQRAYPTRCPPVSRIEPPVQAPAVETKPPLLLRNPGAMQAAVEGPLRRLLPPQVVYSNDRSLLTPAHVRELWEETLPGRELTDQKLQLVIDKSFTVTLALMYEPRGRSLGGSGPLGVGGGGHGNGEAGTEPPARKYKLVGLARSMSDAAFVATVCDVAVSPVLQGRGVGKRLVRNLVTDMRSMGPSSFAVFPWPEHREFFYKCGFRLSHRFIMMKYMRGDDDVVGREGSERAPAKPVELRDTIGVVLATNGVSALLDDIPLSLFETSNPPTLEEKGAPTRS